jgi:DNA-binding transcriptional ArsR family regulator
MTTAKHCHVPAMKDKRLIGTQPFQADGNMKREENYKAIGEGSGKAAIEELKNEVLSPLESDIQKLRDPVVLAALMHTAATERENTNRLLRTLIEKLDAKFAEVDARLARIEAAGATGAAEGHNEVLLPSVDEEILRFVKEKRHVSAEEVRRKFSYKGKNAASARLSRMFELGLLDKKQVGRAVLYFAKKT